MKNRSARRPRWLSGQLIGLADDLGGTEKPVTHTEGQPVMKQPTQQRKAFSLIEMVIVILILGIIAAVAAPRMFDTATTAEENTTRQQLAVLRNAIEMYRARSGIYPSTGDLVVAVGPMLNGPFPAPSIGSAKSDPAVYYDGNTDTTLPATPDTTQPGGWVYKPANGNLRLNIESTEKGNDW